MSKSRPTSQASPDSDETLAVRARGGCRPSYEQLVIRFQVRLLRFLQRHVRSSADAEDLLQETFVRALEHLDQYDESRPFATWLFTIGQRLAVSHLRHSQVVARSGGVLAELHGGKSADEPWRAMAEAESRQLFWQHAAEVLSEEQLSATWLFYVEQMPAPQIAEVLGRSWVSVKTILFRARRKLAPFLAEAAGERSEPADIVSRAGPERRGRYSPAL